MAHENYPLKQVVMRGDKDYDNHSFLSTTASLSMCQIKAINGEDRTQ